jgi:nitroreductase
MKRATVISLIMSLFLGTGVMHGQTAGNSVTDLIIKSYTARSFVDGAVSDSDLELILKCGIKAPSARNSQVWKFTVVKDETLVAETVRGAKKGNIMILVSGAESSQPGINADFDCALAVENMYLAAQALGYGAHMYAGPVGAINASKKEIMGIPAGYRVISILQIGQIDKSVDATSAASARKSIEEVVNYK